VGKLGVMIIMVEVLIITVQILLPPLPSASPAPLQKVITRFYHARQTTHAATTIGVVTTVYGTGTAAYDIYN